MSRIHKSMRTESRLWLPGSLEREEWGVTTDGFRVSFWTNENVLELDS